MTKSLALTVSRTAAVRSMWAWARGPGSERSLGHGPAASTPLQSRLVSNLLRCGSGRGDGCAPAQGSFRLDISYASRCRWSSAEGGSSGGSG